MEMSVNIRVESDLVPSKDGLNFSTQGHGALMVGRSVREFFKAELDNFMDNFHPAGQPSRSLTRRL